MKIKAKDIIVPAAALLIICLVATLLLAVTNSATQGKILLNAEQKEVQSRLVVLAKASQFSSLQTLQESGITYCEGKTAEGESAGYVFSSSAKGYGGDVVVMTGIDTDGKISGISILSHSETPGLGANSTKPEFLQRFIGKSGQLSVSKTSNEGQDIQAITAATITSKAVVQAVNAAVSAYEQITGGASNG